MEYHKGNHSVHALQYHLVLVTKYRRKCIYGKLQEFLLADLKRLIEMREGSVIEINSDLDHVHLLVDLSPKYAIKDVIASIKGSSGRNVKKQFSEILTKFYKNGDAFWSNSYFISSTGGVSLDIIQKYVEDQGKKKRRGRPPKHSSTSHS